MDVYNPWSVLKYVRSGFKPDRYWASTSGNNVINRILNEADSGMFDDVYRLCNGDSVQSDIDPEVTYAELFNNRMAMISVLAMSGYVKCIRSGNTYDVSIPNLELVRVFANMVVVNSGMDENVADRFCTALVKGRTEEITSTLEEMLRTSVSVRVLGDEHAYQSLLIGLLMHTRGSYEVRGDYEAGDGYPDVIMKRVRGDGSNVVIELKKSRTESSTEVDAKAALAQIRSSRYTAELHGPTLLYGVSFFKKNPCVVLDECQLK